MAEGALLDGLLKLIEKYGLGGVVAGALVVVAVILFRQSRGLRSLALLTANLNRLILDNHREFMDELASGDDRSAERMARSQNFYERSMEELDRITKALIDGHRAPLA